MSQNDDSKRVKTYKKGGYLQLNKDKDIGNYIHFYPHDLYSR